MVHKIRKPLFFALAIFGEMLTLQGFSDNIEVSKSLLAKLSTETCKEKLK